MKSQELSDIFADISFEGAVRYMEQMRKHTSLRIGGPADIFIIPGNMDSLVHAYMYLTKSHSPVLPLGGGTNILVLDGGIEGAVLSFTSLQKIEKVKEDGEQVNIEVEGGTLLQQLVQYAMKSGYSGIEGLAGIPGTIGGAIRGNAGAFGYEMKDVIFSVDIINPSGKIRRFRREEIAFGYRSSGILPDELILRAEIRMKKDKKQDVLQRIQHCLKIKRETQPLWEASAGCVFKNPPGFAAGKLIDEAGCKGLRIGDAEVSSLHANFFINKGEANAVDFMRLMEEVARKVREISGVMLEQEIRIVGRDSADR
jgi:UDP-N-acetylmuramate dehydrogenase